MRFSHFFSLLPLTLLCHSVLSHCSLGNPLLPSRLSHEVGLLKFLCFNPDKFPQYAENCSRKSPVAKWCFQRGRSADSLSTSKKGGGHTGSPPQRSFFLTLTHPFVLFFPSRNPASRAFCRIPGPRSAQARNRRRHVSFLSQLESLTLHDFRPCISSFASYQDPSNSPLGGHKGTASREERSPAQRCPLVATTARFSAALSGQFSAYHEQKMVPATPQKRRKCSAGAPQRDPAGAVRTLCMKRDKLDFADKLAEKAQATSPPVNSASRRSPGVRGNQALPRQVKQGSGTTAKEEKITTKAAGNGSDDGHGAATVKAEKPEDGATIASPAGTTNAPRKGKRSKDECDETQEGEAGKDDGEVKTEAKPAKHAAGKKGHAAQNVVPDEPDEVFLKHRALAESSRKFLGAHISAAGGVQNAPLNCLAVGGQAFAFFLKNQRRWDSPPISDESADEFKASVARLKLDGPMHILPHGSYLINLANPDSAKRKVSYNAFLDDLKRCEQVGVHRYVFHPGSTVGNCTKEESIQHVAECLNKAIAATKSVTILVENMAGQKNVLCSQFEDLRDIISLIDNKDRIGVCLDTCHLYSAGHDIRTEESFEAVMRKFDSIVGMSYLKGMHINDSKAPIASGLDRHEHLGKGTLGMAPFKFIMQHPTWFKDMPLILETPEVDNNGPKQWRRETQMMYSFIED